MQDFLNPKSMLTPGLAGSLLMFLVNGIACQFPEIEPRYTALLLSFLIGGSLIMSTKMLVNARIIEKSLYWVLNSIIIFVVGFGSANIANGINQPPEDGKQTISFFHLVPDAYAQHQPVYTEEKSSQHQPRPHPQNNTEIGAGPQADRIGAMQAENEQLKREIEAMKQQKPTSAQPPETGFFRRW